MLETIKQYPFLLELYKGGPVMVPLVLCSLVSVALIIERFVWGPSRKRVLPPELQHDINRLIDQNRLDELLGLCRANKTPLARIVLTALENLGRPEREVVDAVEIAGRNEAMELQRYLPILGTIAAASPLLGLLGTVFGMIETFSVVQTQGAGNPQALAGGISEALITTATGLTIAIPTLMFYRYFLFSTRKLVVEIETIAVHLISRLTRAAHNTPGRDETQAESIETVKSAVRKR